MYRLKHVNWISPYQLCGPGRPQDTAQKLTVPSCDVFSSRILDVSPIGGGITNIHVAIRVEGSVTAKLGPSLVRR